MDCVFCRIAKGEIPSEKVYENNSVLAFLDIKPVTKGHCLVVPKQHYKDMAEAPEKVLEEMIVVAKKIGIACIKAVKADGFNIGINNGSAAGQKVMHLHLHVIPRYKGDGLVHWQNQEPVEELAITKKKIVSSLF